MIKIKRLVIFIFVIMLGLMTVGCNKENVNDMPDRPEVVVVGLLARSVSSPNFNQKTYGDLGYSTVNNVVISGGTIGREPYLVIDNTEEEIYLKVYIDNSSDLEINSLKLTSTDTETLVFQDGEYKKLSDLTAIKWNNSYFSTDTIEGEIYKLKLPTEQRETKITIQAIEYVDSEGTICSSSLNNIHTIVIVKTNFIVINISTIEDKTGAHCVTFDLSNSEAYDVDISIYKYINTVVPSFFENYDYVLSGGDADTIIEEGDFIGVYEYDLSPGSYILRTKCEVMGYISYYLQFFTITAE